MVGFSVETLMTYASSLSTCQTASWERMTGGVENEVTHSSSAKRSEAAARLVTSVVPLLLSPGLVAAGRHSFLQVWLPYD